MRRKVKGCIVLIVCCAVFCGSGIATAEEHEAKHPYKQVIQKLETLSPENSIEVVMASKQRQYNVGDPFELRFRVSEACYATLMHIAADGAISFLTPNVLTPDHKVEGMKVYSTRQDLKLPITVSPPEGVEVVNLFCSSENFNFFQANFSQKEPFYTITPDDEHRLHDLLVKLEQLDDIEWSGGGIQFRVEDDSPVSKGAGARDGLAAPREAGGVLPPIATTGSAGKDPLFPPIEVSGSSGHSEDMLGTD